MQERRRKNGQEIDGSKITTHALALDCKTTQGRGWYGHNHGLVEAMKILNVYDDAFLSISSHHQRRIL
jgi:hypothetical protein